MSGEAPAVAYHFSGRVNITLGYPQTRFNSREVSCYDYLIIIYSHCTQDFFTNHGSTDFDDKEFLYKRVVFFAVILSVAAGRTPATYV